MKIKVENFQSIKEAELEIKGLTVIIGENSIGKSALARALSGVFTNTRGDSHVRNGEKSSSVLVSFDDGNEVLWEKGGGLNQYTVNSKIISKVGSSVPDEVKELGVKAVEVDGREIHPQIAKQFQTIFLLDLPPSALSSALSDVDTIQKLEKASSKARSEIRDIKSRLKIKREDLEEARNAKTLFEGFDYSYALRVEELQREKEALENKIEALEKLKAKRKKLLSAFEILQDADLAQLPPTLKDLPDLNRIMKIQKTKTRAYLSEVAISVGLEGFHLSPFPTLPPILKLEKLSQAKIRLSKALLVLERTPIDPIPHPPKLNQAIPLLEKKSKLLYGLGLAEDQLTSLSQQAEDINEKIKSVKCPICLRDCSHH